MKTRHECTERKRGLRLDRSVQKAGGGGRHCPKGRTPRFHPDNLRDAGGNHFIHSYVYLFIHAFGQLVFRPEVIEHLLCAWHCAGCRGHKNTRTDTAPGWKERHRAKSSTNDNAVTVSVRVAREKQREQEE